MSRRFVWCYDEGDCFKRGAPIRLMHYGDTGFKTRVLDEDWQHDVTPHDICKLLNDAYQAGQDHKLEELRRFLGVKD